MDYGIIESVSFTRFCDSFSDTYKNNFTYEGKKALYDYLIQYCEDTNENIELDTIALCCEYSEYESCIDCVESCQYDSGYEYTEGDTEQDKEEYYNNYLCNNTQVIAFAGGIIIQDF
jgi:hypothetical protein